MAYDNDKLHAFRNVVVGPWSEPEKRRKVSGVDQLNRMHMRFKPQPDNVKSLGLHKWEKHVEDFNKNLKELD